MKGMPICCVRLSKRCVRLCVGYQLLGKVRMIHHRFSHLLCVCFSVTSWWISTLGWSSSWYKTNWYVHLTAVLILMLVMCWWWWYVHLTAVLILVLVLCWWWWYVHLTAVLILMLMCWWWWYVRLTAVLINTDFVPVLVVVLSLLLYLYCRHDQPSVNVD